MIYNKEMKRLGDFIFGTKLSHRKKNKYLYFQIVYLFVCLSVCMYVCYRFSQKLLGRLTPNFDTMYQVTPDVHNKLLVVIQKRAAEPLPVEKNFFAKIFN